MTAKKNNIWSQENTPVLERCSIDRAAELLHCKADDLIHLADSGAISLFRNIPPTEATVVLITDIAFCDEILDIFEKNKNRRIGSQLGFTGSYFLDVSEDIQVSKRHVASLSFDALVSGWWQISPLNSYLRADGIILNPNRFRQASKKEGVRLAHVDLSLEENVSSSEVIIYREDIEALFTSKMTGLPLKSYNNKTVEADDMEYDKHQGRTTTRQSTMIVSLLEAIGISKEDMKGSTIKMEAKLKNIAAKRGIAIPDVDQKTWREWLSREGKR